MNNTFWWWFCATIFTITLLYTTSFLLIVFLGSAPESVQKELKRRSIIDALLLGLEVSYTEQEMSKRLLTCDHTLGGVVDEMVRSEEVVRTGALKPIPHWIITRHPQLS